VPQGAQVHVTQRGFDFVAQNIGTLAGGLLGGAGGTSCPSGGIPFCLPPTAQSVPLIGTLTICGGANVCDDGSPGCQLDICIDPSQVNISGRAPNELVASIGLALDEQLDVDGAINCNVGISADSLPVTAVVRFLVGAPPAEKVSIELPADQLNINTDGLDLSLSGGFGCTVLNFLLGFVQGLLVDQLLGPLTSQLDTLLCTQCTDGTCPAGSTCNDGGQCIIDGSDQCRPIDLGAQGQLDLGSVLAGFAPGLEAQLGYNFNLANYARGTGTSEGPAPGLDLAAQVGVTAEANPCVPYRDPPSVSRVPASAAINADRTPAGEQFSVGIGVSKQVLDLAGWAAYNSGVLCLSLGSETVEQLSTSLFATVLPSLRELTGTADKPISIQLRPQQPPTFALGAGTVTYAADGTASIDDPLLIVSLNDLNLDFYTFIEERYVRIFTLNTDLTIPLGLDVTPNNEIQVLLGDLSAALTRIEPRNGELLRASEVANLSRLLPTLLGSLLPSLTGSLIQPIALPDIQGLRLVLPAGAFTSVESNTMLAIFADLAVAPPVDGGALVMPLTPRITATRVNEQPYQVRRDMLDRASRLGEPVDLDLLTPTVEIDLETLVPGLDDRQLEYSWRVPNGLWSMWQRTSTLKLRDPMFALEGHHEIEVRVRAQDDAYSASPLTATTSFVIDHSPPTVSLERVGRTASYDVFDSVSPSAAVAVRWSANGGDWTSVPAAGTIDLSRFVGDNVEVVVEATDAAGHMASVRKSFRISPDGQSSQSSADRADAEAGCSAGGSGGAGFAALLTMIGLLSTLRRRRVAGLATMVAGLSAALVACGDDNTKSGQVSLCDPACAEGQNCINGACVADADAGADTTECSTDDQCAQGFRCEAGTCVARTDCTDASQCQPGQVCVDGACVAGTACDDVAACPACTGDEVPRCTNGVCGCEIPCPDGCGDDAYCCNSTGACLELPDACDGKDCPPGTRPVPASDSVGDSDSCTATPGQCDCETLPPLPLGNFGQWLDTGTSPDGSRFVVAAYNSTYGDLMVGPVAADGSVAWEFVDGVPSDAEVTGDVAGPRGGIGADGANIGRYASVEVTNEGIIHVSYFADSGDSPKTLFYARGVPSASGHDWTRLAVDASGGAGLYSDLVLDANGQPGIAYLAPGVTDATILPPTYASELRFAQAATPAPSVTSDFTRHVLDLSRNDLACGGTCARADACVTASNVCETTARDNQCTTPCATGEKCFAADGGFTCKAVTTLPKFQLLPNGSGLYADAEYFSTGELGVAYYDSINGNLKYIRVPTDTYIGTPTVVAGETVAGDGSRVDTGDVGRFPDLFIGAGDETWISYLDVTRDDLRLLNVTAGTDELVDDGFRDFGGDVQSSRVGADSNISVVGDQIVLTYNDSTEHTIVETARGTSGWTAPATIAGGNRSGTYSGAYGFYLSVGRPAGGRALVSYRLNTQASPSVRDIQIIRR
jgi:hypothetical protein